MEEGFTLFSHLIFLAISLGFFLYHGVYPTFYWLQIFYYMFCLSLLCAGLGLITATVTVFIPDMQNVVNIFVQLFFWATPIFWSLSMLPEKYAAVLAVNPMAYIVQGYRDAFLSQGLIWQHGWDGLIFWTLTIALLLIGILLLRKMKPHFADVL